MFGRKYYFLVAYNWERETENGSGSATVESTDKNILLSEVDKWLKDTNNFTKVAFINIIRITKRQYDDIYKK